MVSSAVTIADGVPPRKRTAARHHLVQHRAEGEDVAAPVGRPPFDLLGRHVCDRPEHGARGGDAAARS